MDGDPFWTKSKICSALVVVVYVVLAAHFRGGEVALRLFLFCLLPIMCIWFPEFMGAYRGWCQSETSPAPAVYVAGWMLLASPIVAALVLYRVF